MGGRLSVLFVPRSTARCAPTRVRITQVLPFFERAGVPYRVFSSISDWTTRQTILAPRFTGLRRLLHYLAVFIEPLLRLPLVLILARRYAVVYLQRTYYPFGLERLLRRANPNIVFDFDDAIFIPDPDSNKLGPLERLKEHFRAAGFSRILKVSKLAVANNEFLAEEARRHCANVAVFTEAIDVTRYKPRRHGPTKRVNVGWIGSPSTSEYLEPVIPVLAELQRRRGIAVTLIGAGDYRRDGLKIDNHPWSEETEAGLVEGFDIGIHPTQPTLWAEGKFGTKMLQYMSAGVPSVVSMTRANASVIRQGINGFIATTPEEWRDFLERLILDPGLRERIGLAGRRTVEEEYALSVKGPRFVELIRSSFAE